MRVFVLDLIVKTVVDSGFRRRARLGIYRKPSGQLSVYLGLGYQADGT